MLNRLLFTWIGFDRPSIFNLGDTVVSFFLSYLLNNTQSFMFQGILRIRAREWRQVRGNKEERHP